MEGTLQLQVAVVGKEKRLGWRNQNFCKPAKINSALGMGIYMYLYWCNIERVWDAGNS